MAQSLSDRADVDAKVSIAATTRPTAIAPSENNQAAVQPAANGDALKVFISYSRADMAIADALVEALESNGFGVAIDRRDLPYGEEWQKELANFIATSDTVVWLVSPHSMKSKWCNWELGEVGRLSKRLVPVKVREIDPNELPEALGRIHLLPAEGAYDAGQHEAKLIAALNTDRTWHMEATKLGERAREWMQNGRDKGRLLRGGSLSTAETWSLRTPRDVSAPAPEILELILGSRGAQRHRQRMTVVGSLAAAIVAIGLAATAVVYQQRAQQAATEAERQKGLAEDNQAKAEEQSRKAVANESVSLAALARFELSEGRAADAAKLALAAWPRPTDPTRPMTRRAFEVVANAAILLQDPAPMKGDTQGEYVLVIRFMPDSQFAVVAVKPVGEEVSTNITIWDLKKNAFVSDIGQHDGYVSKISVSRDGSRIATTGLDQTVRAWDVPGRRELGRLARDSFFPKTTDLTPDGRKAITAGFGAYVIWDTADGHEIARLDDSFAKAAAFSPDGRRFVTGSSLGILEVRDTSTMALVASLKPKKDDYYDIRGVSFSRDGNLLLTTSDDHSVRLWNVAQQVEVFKFTAHKEEISDAVLSTDASMILTCSADNTFRIWNFPGGRELLRVEDISFCGSVDWSPDDSSIAVAMGVESRIWDIRPITSTDAFGIACQWLGDNIYLGDVQERYGLGELTPICGENAPLPVDWSKLQ